MGRFKDVDWRLPEGTNGNAADWSTARLAVLMDIRDELKRLNNTMSAVGCIHSTMKGLRRDIAQARRGHRKKI